MKTSWMKIGSAFSLVIASTLITACGAGDMMEFDGAEGDTGDMGAYSDETELGSLEQGLHGCATPDGTNSVMAALAVAAAQDLGRWHAGVDFNVVGDRIALASGTGPDGQPKGKSRCGGNCRRIEPLLALQNDNATGVYVQAETANSKVLVNPSALRSRMKAKLEEQRTKDANAKDGPTYLAPKTLHRLTGAGSASLGGCGPHFKFNVAFNTPVTPPAKPVIGQLKNALFFADQNNGWVDFRDLGNNVVAIDPTYGLNDGATSSAGSCEVACTKISSSSVAGRCCSCAGAQKKFKTAAFNASVFLCQ